MAWEQQANWWYNPDTGELSAYNPDQPIDLGPYSDTWDPQTVTTGNWQNMPINQYSGDIYRLYDEVASGKTSLTPDQFSLLFSSGDRTISPYEFGLLPADVQKLAYQDPQWFMQQAYATRNPANSDLLSVGAEGGFSYPQGVTVNPDGSLNWSGAGYMDIHDEGTLGDFGPLVALASIIPSPIQPFAAAINMAGSIADDNPLGAVLSAYGLGNSLGAFGPMGIDSGMWEDAAGNLYGGGTSSPTDLSALDQDFSLPQQDTSYANPGQIDDNYFLPNQEGTEFTPPDAGDVQRITIEEQRLPTDYVDPGQIDNNYFLPNQLGTESTVVPPDSTSTSWTDSLLRTLAMNTILSTLNQQQPPTVEQTVNSPTGGSTNIGNLGNPLAALGAGNFLPSDVYKDKFDIYNMSPSALYAPIINVKGQV